MFLLFFVVNKDQLANRVSFVRQLHALVLLTTNANDDANSFGSKNSYNPKDINRNRPSQIISSVVVESIVEANSTKSKKSVITCNKGKYSSEGASIANGAL